MSYYAECHNDEAVTTEGLADVILTMRWRELERAVEGILNTSSAVRVKPMNLHNWAVAHKQHIRKMARAKEVAAKQAERKVKVK